MTTFCDEWLTTLKKKRRLGAGATNIVDISHGRPIVRGAFGHRNDRMPRNGVSLENSAFKDVYVSAPLLPEAHAG